jgi:predicted adenine nucleotide alpha hydrolase (AANH) superfamily ATPase
MSQAGKSLLLHVCCAPCSAFSVPALREEGFTVSGYFYNPNIHPFPEYLRRSEALSLYQPDLGIDIHFDEDYQLEDYFRAALDNFDERCRGCYTLRLTAAAREAKRQGCDAFTSTLLFSIYQNHDLLRAVGGEVGESEGVAFHYRDLREGWQEGGSTYRASGLYRQNYCGCLFSEKERIERKKVRKEKAGP